MYVLQQIFFVYVSLLIIALLADLRANNKYKKRFSPFLIFLGNVDFLKNFLPTLRSEHFYLLTQTGTYHDGLLRWRRLDIRVKHHRRVVDELDVADVGSRGRQRQQQLLRVHRTAGEGGVAVRVLRVNPLQVGPEGDDDDDVLPLTQNQCDHMLKCCPK